MSVTSTLVYLSTDGLGRWRAVNDDGTLSDRSAGFGEPTDQLDEAGVIALNLRLARWDAETTYPDAPADVDITWPLEDH